MIGVAVSGIYLVMPLVRDDTGIEALGRRISELAGTPGGQK
jgi:hypothetical protein